MSDTNSLFYANFSTPQTISARIDPRSMISLLARLSQPMPSAPSQTLNLEYDTKAQRPLPTHALQPAHRLGTAPPPVLAAAPL
jgi:hypothetical protein